MNQTFSTDSSDDACSLSSSFLPPSHPRTPWTSFSSDKDSSFFTESFRGQYSAPSRESTSMSSPLHLTAYSLSSAYRMPAPSAVSQDSLRKGLQERTFSHPQTDSLSSPPVASINMINMNDRDNGNRLGPFKTPPQINHVLSTNIDPLPYTVDPRQLYSPLPTIMLLGTSDSESSFHDDASSIFSSSFGYTSHSSSPASEGKPLLSYSEAHSPSPSNIHPSTSLPDRRRRPDLARPHRPQLPRKITPPCAGLTATLLRPPRQTGKKSKREEDDDGDDIDRHVAADTTHVRASGHHASRSYGSARPSTVGPKANLRDLPSSPSSSATPSTRKSPSKRPAKRVRRDAEASPVYCTECNKEFKHTRDRDRHLRESCSSAPRVTQAYECTTCNMSLSRQDALLRHRRSKSCKKAQRLSKTRR